MSIKLYEVDHEYIDYLAPFAPHLFHNKKQEQQNERKYIGVILVVDDMKYFAEVGPILEEIAKERSVGAKPKEEILAMM